MHAEFLSRRPFKCVFFGVCSLFPTNVTLNKCAHFISPALQIIDIYMHAHIRTQIRPAFGSSGVGHGGSVAPAAHAIKMQRQALVRHQASLGGPGAYSVPQVCMCVRVLTPLHWVRD
jgi:hypothetical protein